MSGLDNGPVAWISVRRSVVSISSPPYRYDEPSYPYSSRRIDIQAAVSIRRAGEGDDGAPHRDHLRMAVGSDALSLSVLAAQVFLDTYAVQGVRPAIVREVRQSLSEEAYAGHLADPRHATGSHSLADR